MARKVYLDQTYCDNNYGAGSAKSLLNRISVREEWANDDDMIIIFEHSRQYDTDIPMEYSVTQVLNNYPGNKYPSDPTAKIGEFVILVSAHRLHKNLPKLEADGVVMTQLRPLSEAKAWGTNYLGCYRLYLVESIQGINCRLG